MDQAVSDVMLITIENGNMVSCQPKTVREMVEFKEQYPNAQAVIVKTSEQKWSISLQEQKGYNVL